MDQLLANKVRNFFSRFYSLIRIVAFLLVLNVLWFNSIRAQGISLPNNIQAALLIKVLKFNPRLADKQDLKLLIVFSQKTRLGKDELMAELKSKNVKVEAIQLPELEANIKDCDLVYFMPGLQDFQGVCKANKVLSVTGISKYVENGDMSIALGLQNDKPKIFVNLTSLKMEDQNLSSDLLRIAKVYK